VLVLPEEDATGEKIVPGDDDLSGRPLLAFPHAGRPGPHREGTHR
jgi:hypothetical protein